jgi:hypothetical protein
MSSKVTVETRPNQKAGDNDPWKEFCFVQVFLLYDTVSANLTPASSVVRTLPQNDDQSAKQPTFKVVIKSEYILKACKEVIKTWHGVSWNSDPLEVRTGQMNPSTSFLLTPDSQLDPEIFVTFLSNFIDYRDKLADKKRTTEESHVLTSVDVLLEWLHSDYCMTIATIKNLTSHGEIEFDLLYALLVPRTIFVAQCAITGEPCALQLISFTPTVLDGLPVYQLYFQNVDMVDKPMTNTIGVGRVQSVINLPYFKGTAKMTSLNAFPIHYHPDKGLRQSLIERGRKWLSLAGVHHKEYKGVAASKREDKLSMLRVRFAFAFQVYLLKCRPSAG